jgi:hypothetical protein
MSSKFPSQPSGPLTGNFLSDISTDASGNASVIAKPGCQVTLMEFFANSFGKQFVGMSWNHLDKPMLKEELLTRIGNHTPPSCIGTSNAVIMNLTVTSKGVQFDRLALMQVFLSCDSCTWIFTET